MHVGKNIKSLRKAYGESGEKLGEIIHLGKAAVSKLENTERIDDIPRDRLSAIARHYGVTVESLQNDDYTKIEKMESKKLKQPRGKF